MRLGFWVSVVSRSQFLCLSSNGGWYGEWWRRGLNRLGLVLCFSGVDWQLVLWVDFGVMAMVEFQFHGGCWQR